MRAHDRCAEELWLNRFHIEHFIGGAEACGFIEAAAFLRGVQSDDADATAARLGEGEIDQVAGKAAAAVFGLDVNIEQVAARGGSRVERVRGPVEKEEAGASNDLAVIFAEPAEVLALGDGLGDPRLVRLRHDIEDLIVAAAGIDEHTAAVMSDERSVVGCGRPRLQHDEQYRA